MKKWLYILICLTGLSTSSQAVFYSINGNTNDTIYGLNLSGNPTSTASFASAVTLPLGDDNPTSSRGDAVGIIMFQLPVLTAELVTNATLRISWYSGYPGGPATYPKHCLLHGIRYGTNNLTRTTDYAFKGAPAGNVGTLIQSNVFTITASVATVGGTNETDIVGNANLASWINDQYTAGAKGGDYVFLRLSMSDIVQNPVNIASANSVTMPVPRLTLDTLDISSGPCELVFTNTTPVQFVQKPFVITDLPFAVYNAGYNATNVIVSVAANYPWLTINGATSTNITSISGAKPVGPAATATNLFNVTIAANAPVGIHANAFTLTMSGTGLDGTNKTFSAPVSLEILNTVFSSISKTSFAAATNGTDTATLTISNTAAFALAFNLTHSPSAAWLTYPATTQTLPANSATTITVTANGSLAGGSGQYSSVLSVNYLNNTSTQTNFPVVFDVGPKIEPLASSAVVTEAGGINQLPGQYEPGEFLNVTITSTNNGAITVNNITNTLTGPAGFVISPASAIYPSMTVGSKTSTTYQVSIPAGASHGTYTFTAENSADGSSWSRTFSLNVYSLANPSVFPTNLTINVPVNGTETGTITLTNAGNKSTTFALTDNGAWAVTYLVSTQTMSMVSFPEIYDVVDPSNTFVNWSGNDTALMNIGFKFPFYGTVYTNFSVSRYGALGFGTNVGANISTPLSLPSGNSPLSAAFWGNTTVATNSVRYAKQADKLVVAWGNRTGKEFQAWIYTNGQIRYLYQQATWNDGVIGTQSSSNLYQTVNYTPGSGSQSVLLTPLGLPWVTPSVTNGTLGALSSQVIIYTANAAGQAAGTNTFNVTVTWGDGSTRVIAVTVIVASSSPNLGAPTSVTFAGPAGDITKTNMTITNTGDIPVDYTITDTGAQTSGYVWTNAPFRWDNSPWDSDFSSDVVMIDGADYSPLIPIGFPFSFYGNIYTQLSIGVNGGISLGKADPMNLYQIFFQTNVITGAITNSYLVTNFLDTSLTPPRPNSYSALTNAIPNQLIAPFWDLLYLTTNSSVRYSSDRNSMVVTWENMARQTGNEKELTFQAILNRNGSIRFQYKYLTGTNAWSQARIGLRDTASRFKTASLIRYSEFAEDPGTVTYTTNYMITTNGYVYDTPVVVTNITVTTNYSETVTEETVLFTPSTLPVISVDPVSGNLPVGGTQMINIIGDARSLTLGGTNNVFANTIFSVYHPGLIPNITTNIAGGVTNVLTNLVIATVSKPVSVLFIATNSVDTAFSALDSDADGMSDRTEALAGTDEYDADSVFGMGVVQNADGSRSISWPRANDNLSRTYTVWYTTDLLSSWIELYSNDNFSSYTDRDHADVPVIYYRVTVK